MIRRASVVLATLLVAFVPGVASAQAAGSQDSVRSAVSHQPSALSPLAAGRSRLTAQKRTPGVGRRGSDPQGRLS